MILGGLYEVCSSKKVVGCELFYTFAAEKYK
jgi:hypothetical protein